MQTIKFIILSAIAIFVFGGCDDESSRFIDAKPRFQETSQPECEQGHEKNVSLENFVIPDSINKSLLVVCFFEELPQKGYSVIVYEDTNKTTATKTKYCDDGKILKDKLTTVSPHYFTSTDQRGKYFIKEQTVDYSYQQSSCAACFEYRRTDMQLASGSLWQLPLPVVQNTR